MTKFVEVQTQDLYGPALDWAVAQVEKVKVTVNSSFSYKVFIGDKKGLIKALYEPSSDWATGGPLIAKYQMDFCCEHPETIGAALCDENGMYIDERMMFGKTHLIAACRAIVAANFGESISAPSELLP